MGDGRSIRVWALAAATLALAACAGTVPEPRTTANGPGDRPWSPSGLPLPQARPPATVPARIDPGINRPPPGLEPVIHEIWRTFPGRTGIAIRRIDGNWSLARRGDEFFPQQSVSKTWVAMAALDALDRGQIALTDRVRITPDDLTLFHQPLAGRVQREGNVEMTVAELLETAITGSDNTANDSLLRHIGGPDVVRRYVERHSLGRIRFGPGERLLQSRIAGLEWQQRYSVARNFQVAREQVPMSVRRMALERYVADPDDGASPLAIVDALTRLARGELLSPASTRLMIETMGRTRSGPQRLRAGVPAGWSVAHKTGTGQELAGTATGYNDIGILTAPDGTRYAVAVMLASTTASIPQRMAMMQSVSRAVATYHGQ
ncbi:class A beta-lactamase [Sphingomonas lacunae]|uniref:beta-lactamase n=2 Tax=Sphingomonas lacunae TaxID=2698828 RepID=A0A6M4AWY1_9SPHN|nr:class A beta-lactamase [Sphingomonas lacunae]